MASTTSPLGDWPSILGKLDEVAELKRQYEQAIQLSQPIQLSQLGQLASTMSTPTATPGAGVYTGAPFVMQEYDPYPQEAAPSIKPLKFHGAVPPGQFLDVVKKLPLRPDHLWLCGGAVRRYREGGYAQMDGDWDLFMSKSVTEEWLDKSMTNAGAVSVKAKAGTLEWDLPTEHGTARIQAITFRRFATPAKALAAFDFSICQAMVTMNRSGVPVMNSSVDFEKDVPDRILRPANPRSLAGFLRRMQKFVQMGYYMPPEVVDEWVNRLRKLPAGSGTEDYFELPEDALL